MATVSVFLTIDGENVVANLRDAGDRLDGAEREAVLDFSSVLRIDAGALRALEELADIADQKDLKLALRSVNVHVYKVLKLTKLTRRFAFVV